MRKVAFLMRKVTFLMSKLSFLMSKVSFLISKVSLLMSKAGVLMRKPRSFPARIVRPHKPELRSVQPKIAATPRRTFPNRAKDAETTGDEGIAITFPQRGVAATFWPTSAFGLN